MPSPFPGMDPYLEPSRWQGFHLRLVAALARSIRSQLTGSPRSSPTTSCGRTRYCGNVG
jgi:hypothetical protein